jgi:sulfur carrier protein
MTTIIEVTVNGQPRQIPPGTSVGELVAMVSSLPSGIAATLVGDGDLVEIVTAVQGG